MVASALERMQIGQYSSGIPPSSPAASSSVAIAAPSCRAPLLSCLTSPVQPGQARVVMRSELKRLHHDTGGTIIYVTTTRWRR